MRIVSEILINTAHLLANMICFILLFYGIFKKIQYRSLSAKFNQNIQIAKQVVHDLRSPLSALEIILKRLPELHESKYMIAKNAIAHIHDITNHFEKNNLSKKINHYTVEKISVLLNDAILERHEAFSAYQITIDRNFSIDVDTIFVRVIRHELKSIFINIINNACEALPSCIGAVCISLSRINNHAVVVISDNGIGFSKKKTSRFFTRGFTTKSNGSGLGLSHAKENIERWGGSIELSANEIDGASVVISLPIQRQ